MAWNASPPPVPFAATRKQGHGRARLHLPRLQRPTATRRTRPRIDWSSDGGSATSTHPVRMVYNMRPETLCGAEIEKSKTLAVTLGHRVCTCRSVYICLVYIQSESRRNPSLSAPFSPFHCVPRSPRFDNPRRIRCSRGRANPRGW